MMMILFHYNNKCFPLQNEFCCSLASWIGEYWAFLQYSIYYLLAPSERNFPLR